MAPAEEDILILKLDPDGNIQWQKIYRTSSRDIVADMIQTYDGGYILAGIIGYNYFTGTIYNTLVVKLHNGENIKKIHNGRKSMRWNIHLKELV